ncbi:hypothetical protein FX988_03425 [Paraglaciecola mesophila]|uniref:Uncharacterized protein n=1 Tax=Paraglaciecola mesophila TaxID=197222 RepID=A0A857JNV6_9ALTE|nr:hypothetical protein FX988_03425 [Paraglaciecola mesophila]
MWALCFRDVIVRNKFVWLSFLLLVSYSIFILMSPSYISSKILIPEFKEQTKERMLLVNEIIARSGGSIDSKVALNLIRFENESIEKQISTTENVLGLSFQQALILPGLLLIHLASLLRMRRLANET